MDIKNEMVQRWAVFENVTQEIFGAPGDGSSIDFDEPFVLRKQFKPFTFFSLMIDNLLNTIFIKVWM